jgi:hypothetical protein
MAGVRHSGLSNVSSADQTITDDLVVTDALDVNGNTKLGNATTDLVRFHGASTTGGGQMAVQTLATAATLGTVKTSIQTLLAALKKKGLMATS